MNCLSKTLNLILQQLVEGLKKFPGPWTVSKLAESSSPFLQSSLSYVKLQFEQDYYESIVWISN